MEERTIGIIGKSKTGKTRKILFEEVKKEINNKNSLVIYDENLEYYNNFFEELNNENYNVKVINFKEPFMSNGWDPLEYMYYLYDNGKIDRAIELVQNMGKNLFYSNQADPFWSNAAASYFTGLVLILFKIAKEENDKKALNFYSVLELMNQGEEKYGDSNYLMEYIKKIDSMDPIYISLSPIVFAPVETRGSILSVVRQKLNLYFTRPQLLKSFTNSGFKVEEVKREDKVALFIIGYKPHNLLTNILLEQVFDIVDNYNKEITFILDGMDYLPKIDFIDKMIDSANRGKMKLFITIRNKDILKEKYQSILTFSNMEKIINLDEIVNIKINDKNSELPRLENKELERLNFKKYVR